MKIREKTVEEKMETVKKTNNVKEALVLGTIVGIVGVMVMQDIFWGPVCFFLVLIGVSAINSDVKEDVKVKLYNRLAQKKRLCKNCKSYNTVMDLFNNQSAVLKCEDCSYRWKVGLITNGHKRSL